MTRTSSVVLFSSTFDAVVAVGCCFLTVSAIATVAVRCEKFFFFYSRELAVRFGHKKCVDSSTQNCIFQIQPFINESGLLLNRVVFQVELYAYFKYTEKKQQFVY